MDNDIAIIGAGYAGLAAGVELCAAGRRPCVFESSRTLGGRARRVMLDGTPLDNGQHILIGAYRATLALMRDLGLDPQQSFLRLPLTLDYPQSFRLSAPRLPAPLHLAGALLLARGLDWPGKFAAARFMRALQAIDFRLPADMTVAELLKRHRQTQAACRYLWEPLCISALNTPSPEASAQIFLNVLRDSLAAERQASDLLLPRRDLSALLPEAAAARIEQAGGEVLRGQAVKNLQALENGFLLNKNRFFRQVILAVAPYHLPALTAELPVLEDLRAGLARMQWQPIATCYLRYPAAARLPLPMHGLVDGPAHWLFDRGQIDGAHGWYAAVISAHGTHEDFTHAALTTAIQAQIAHHFPGLPPAQASHLIVEKRATFACTPNLQRPPTRTTQSGLYLAGDYVAADYPATLEAAVRSGQAAAQAALQAG